MRLWEWQQEGIVSREGANLVRGVNLKQMKDTEGSECEADYRRTDGTIVMSSGEGRATTSPCALAAEQVRLGERKSYIRIGQNSCFVNRTQ